MEASSLVSIIIPTYNREKKLPEAIESALNQSYKNTQIIVIDDGSVDQTSELIKKYPQVEYYYKKMAVRPQQEMQVCSMHAVQSSRRWIPTIFGILISFSNA